MGVLVALRFLTVLPLPHRDVAPEDMGRSLAYFPLVGLILGAMLAGLDVLLRMVFPISVASAVVLVALVVLTGALHLDGLMDSCDGIFGRRDPNRRLEIMRDSRVGSFGALGAFGLLLIEFVALVELTGPLRVGGLILMPVLGRWAMVLAVWGFPYARMEGLGRAFKDDVGWRQVAAATFTAALVAVVSLQLVGIIVMLAAGVTAWLLASFACTRVPGLTGDTYGAVDEVVEVVSLLAILAITRAGYG